jgi:hypothetical protein
MISKTLSLRVLLVLCVATALSGLAAAQSYKVASSAAAAPDSLAAPIRAELSANTLTVSGASGPICEIWLAKPVQPATSPDTELGVNFGQISQGALVGAMKLDAASSDFRGQKIQPGVFTLRYMLEPVDGNHQGVSDYRDFLLLVPASLDTSAAVMPTADLLNLSRKASGTGHPSVWSLVPPDTTPASLPVVVHQQESTDQWVVFFEAPLAKPVPMGLVFIGHGQIS